MSLNSDSSANQSRPPVSAIPLKPILKSGRKPTSPPEAKRTSRSDSTRTARQDKVLFRPTETEPSQTTGTPPTTYAEVTATNVCPDSDKNEAIAAPVPVIPLKQQVRYKLKITVPANIADPAGKFVKTVREVFSRIQTHCGKNIGIGAWDNENTSSPVLKKASAIPGGKDYAGRLLWAEYFGSYLAPKTYPDSRDSWLNLCFHINGPTLIPPRKWGMELQAILSDIEHKAFFAKNPKCCQAAKSLTVGWLLLCSKTGFRRRHDSATSRASTAPETVPRHATYRDANEVFCLV
jgi:hypothetical protein